mgnify:CR=1 FL=1
MGACRGPAKAIARARGLALKAPRKIATHTQIVIRQLQQRKIAHMGEWFIGLAVTALIGAAFMALLVALFWALLALTLVVCLLATASLRLVKMP